jgi:hypothetical protein
MPVREAIHRSHEKAKQMQLMKERQNQAGQQQYYDQGGANKKRKTGSSAPRKELGGGRMGSSKGNKQQQMMQMQQQQQQMMQQRGGYGQQQMRGGYGQQQQRYPQQQQVIMQVNRSGPRPQEDHTLINTFTIEEIETHIESLNTGLQMPGPKLKQKCMDILNVIMKHQCGYIFNDPVDPVTLGLTDYFEVVKKPMDLGKVKNNVEKGMYHAIEGFREDVLLVFDNALLYNPEKTPVWNMAVELKKAFGKEFDNFVKELKKEQRIKCQNGEACLLCGCEKLNFEPPVFYCNGAKCQAKRIRRNSYYYVAVGNQYHWCHQCYQELKEANPVEMADMTVRKSELGKKKNDEVHEESWVACDTCGRWIHQICGLFNTRQNKDQRSEYDCPRCTIDKRKASGELEPKSSTPGAEDLPRTRLSEYLERHIREMSVAKFKEYANEIVERDHIEFDEALANFTADNAMGSIYIRQVTSMDKKIDVRDGMKKRYAFENYPEEFSYRCKCLCVFQKIEGVDVMLFGLYVYEHDDKNPGPNTRCVYVSYLDSVHFMKPRKIRTFIYHELLISYLDYVRQKGFATAHIWACPPLKGDDYILYAKPEDQKTPKTAQLTDWYVNMLKTCEERGIVKSTTNMYDLYFADVKNHATVIPYLEGDYWVNEAESIIKEINDGNEKKGKKKQEQELVSKSKQQKQKQSGALARGGTRSTGLDEDALIASGIVAAPPKSLEDGGRDILMVKLGEAIQPMKESFLVAFLNWEDATAKRTAELEEEARNAANAEEKEKVIMEKKKLLDSGKAKEEEDHVRSNDGLGGVDDTSGGGGIGDNGGNDNDDNKGGKNGNGAVVETASSDASNGAINTTVSSSSSSNVNASASADATGAGSMDVDEQAESDMLKDETVGNSDFNDAVVSTSSSGGNGGASSRSTRKRGRGDVDCDVDNVNANGDDVKVDGKAGASGEVKVVKVKEEVVDDADGVSAGIGNSNDDGNGNGNGNNGSSSMDVDDKSSVTTKNGGDVKGVKMEDVENTVSEKNEKDAAVENVGGSDGEIKKDGADAAIAADAKEGVGTNDNEKGDGVSNGGATDDNKKSTTEVYDPVAEEAKRVIEDAKKISQGFTKISLIPSHVRNKDGTSVKVIDDDNEDMDCEFLNSRQAFLNLCQVNHYQNDTLRRAKHTSMMVLWHLHNRDAPKFVQQCWCCSREILSGFRYHCPVCSDFDICQDCIAGPMRVQPHIHQLKPIAVSQQQSTLTEAQRKERQRSIQLHMQLLSHAANCNSENKECPSANCNKMKGLLAHGKTCKTTAAGGCPVCKRIWALFQLHARQCKESNCKVPNCSTIRERARQMQKQQQAMDDRRRVQMNQMRGGGAG